MLAKGSLKPPGAVLTQKGSASRSVSATTIAWKSLRLVAKWPASLRCGKAVAIGPETRAAIVRAPPSARNARIRLAGVALTVPSRLVGSSPLPAELRSRGSKRVLAPSRRRKAPAVDRLIDSICAVTMSSCASASAPRPSRVSSGSLAAPS